MTSDALSGLDRLAGVPPDPEAALVRAAKARDESAWTQIYAQHYEKVYRYMLGRVGERETAEDLAASVFVEALKSIDRYRSQGRPLLAWLYAIARNLANYHHRTAYRRQALGVASAGRGRTGDDTENEIGDQTPGGGDPAALVEGWDLRQAVSRLSGDQREVVLLRFFVGLTTPQVAALLGKTERAVYSLQARAVQALRRRLA